jgi:hypothetical protein
MRIRGRMRFHSVLLLVLPSVSIAYEGAISADRKFDVSSQPERRSGSIPPDGPLARPKSLKQTGVPVEAARAAAPADNHNVVAESCRAEQEINSDNTIDVDRAAIQSDMSVLGRFLVTKKDADIASFKTPGLRNVLITAPYFHDGSQATLWDVVDHYNKGDGIKDPWLDEDMQPLGLREPEIDDVVAFLASLTSSQYQDQGERELQRQRLLSHTSRPQRDSARAFGPKPVQPKPLGNCAAANPEAKPR